jgi:hypothetical protein
MTDRDALTEAMLLAWREVMQTAGEWSETKAMTAALTAIAAHGPTEAMVLAGFRDPATAMCYGNLLSDRAVEGYIRCILRAALSTLAQPGDSDDK